MGVMAIWGARVCWALSPRLSPTHTQSGGLKTLQDKSVGVQRGVTNDSKVVRIGD